MTYVVHPRGSSTIARHERQEREPAGGHPKPSMARTWAITALAGVARERTPLRPTTPEPVRAADPR